MSFDPVPGGVGSGGADPLDLDLNIVPVIDCLTVLITFLLVSASFISIGMIGTGAASFSEKAAATTDPRHDVLLSVRMGAQGGWLLRLTGRKVVTVSVPPWADGRRDYEGLTAAIEKAREEFPELGEAAVSADPSIEYREVVRAVETVRRQVPKVYVGS